MYSSFQAIFGSENFAENQSSGNPFHQSTPEALPLLQPPETCTQTEIGGHNSQRTDSNSEEDHNYSLVDITEFTSGGNKNRAGNLNDNNTDPGLVKFKVNKTDTPFMLYDYLNNDIDGKAIIKAYEDKKFNAKIRNLLVRRLINREKEKAFKTVQFDKSPKFCLSPEVLKQYSAEIATVFPNENPSVYYIPYENKNGIKIGPSGKLVSHYNYIVGDLKRKGLIKSELSHKEKSTSAAPVELACSETFSTDDIDNHLTVLGSLEKQLDIDILKSWQISLQYRRTLLTQTSLNDYYNRFPCLEGELALRLIESDFNQLYPSTQNKIIANWSNLKNKVINLLLTTRRPKEVEEVALINTLRHLEEEDKDAIIWHFLPRLISAPYIQKLSSDESEGLAIKKRKVTKRRVTVAEARYSSFLIVPNISEIDETVKRRQEYLSKNNISCQPIAVLVGALDKVEDSYVYIENKRHRTKSTLGALDFTFKSFFCLNCEYPCAAVHVWTLIQKILYEINLEREFSSISLHDFITDLEQMY